MYIGKRAIKFHRCTEIHGHAVVVGNEIQEIQSRGMAESSQLSN